MEHLTTRGHVENKEWVYHDAEKELGSVNQVKMQILDAIWPGWTWSVLICSSGTYNQGMERCIQIHLLFLFQYPSRHYVLSY